MRSLDSSRDLRAHTRRLAKVLTRTSLLHAKFVLDPVTKKIQINSLKRVFQKPVEAAASCGACFALAKIIWFGSLLSVRSR
jgi:hypothetical protein